MAIVADSSANNIFPIDRKLCSPNATLAASPVSSRTPTFVGEIVNDSTNGKTWRAYRTGNTEWEVIYRE